MPLFDTTIVVDWSARNTPSPKKPGPDAIWLSVARNGAADPAQYFRTRAQAMDFILGLLVEERNAGRRVLVGFDFPFGYPRGFAHALAGERSAFAVWAELEARVKDGADNSNNRFDVAAEINRLFSGIGPFWGRPEATPIPDLPSRGNERTPEHGMLEKRRVEARVASAQSPWKLYTTGSVGGQALTGIPWLSKLRRDPRLSSDVAVWPFETGLSRPCSQVTLAEVYPSLLARVVEERLEGRIKDVVQVETLAEALSRLDAREGLAPLFTPELDEAEKEVVALEEGWILGAGFEAELRVAAANADDCYAMPRGVDWAPVDEVLSRLEDSTSASVGVETVDIGSAGGRILAEPLVAKRAHPPTPNSAVDGFGYCHGSWASESRKLVVVDGRSAAGSPYPQGVEPGQALRILTGAALPSGVDTVAMSEDVTVLNSEFRAPDVKKGSNTRPVGEDVQAGEQIASTGQVLPPQGLAMATAVGLGSARVRNRLRVGVLSTGDEIVAASAAARTDQVYDANRPMLLDLVARWGMIPVDLGHVGDTPAAVVEALDRGALEADAILTSGGASAGDEDHVSAILSENGALQTWRIAIKPGRPLAIAKWRGASVFGLPGNPVAAFVCALVFARPTFLKMAGGSWITPLGFEVPAAFAKRKRAGRREYLRARLNEEGAAEVFASEGSGRISSLVWASGLVELADGAREIEHGDAVRYLPFTSFGL